jgi:hypothetical protein
MHPELLGPKDAAAANPSDGGQAGSAMLEGPDE